MHHATEWEFHKEIKNQKISQKSKQAHSTEAAQWQAKCTVTDNILPF